MPAARIACNSRSCDIRPKTINAATRIPHGMVNVRACGISRATILKISESGSSSLTKSSKICLKAFPKTMIRESTATAPAVVAII